MKGTGRRAGAMAVTARHFVLAVTVPLLFSTAGAIGVNYGGRADNLPPATATVALVKTTSINKIKLYDARADILTAFAGTGIDIIIGAGNDKILPLAQDPSVAIQWVAANVVPYTTTSIVGICLGNEVLALAPELAESLLPAMQNLHTALVAVGLGEKVKVSTPHSLAVLGNSYPPSMGTFHIRDAKIIGPMLEFLSQTGAPFMINSYPYFALNANPKNVSLEYALFQPNAPTVTDKNTKLVYHNMFDAQVDAIYAAIGRLGYTNVSVTVAECGWPAQGEPTEVVATPTNAQLFNAGLIKHVESRVGTPARPNVTVETFIFALYNENLKLGPLSERNWGLFLTTGVAVYNAGLKLGDSTLVPSPLQPAPGNPIQGPSWCVAKPEADLVKLQRGLDYACSEGLANCVPIQPGAPCFEPNTVAAHASYAYSSYYQINNRNFWNCYFDDTGMIVTIDPSTPTCKFPTGA